MHVQYTGGQPIDGGDSRGLVYVRVHQESRPGLMLKAGSVALGLVTFSAPIRSRPLVYLQDVRLQLRAGMVAIYRPDIQIEE